MRALTERVAISNFDIGILHFIYKVVKTKQQKMKIDKKLIMPVAITAVVVAIISFYGGMKYVQQNSAGARQQFSQQARSQRTGGFQAVEGGLITGQVSSKDSQSITVKTRDGSSRIVFYSSSTAVNKQVAGSTNDISPGTEVMVGGMQNSDGSFTAQSIQIRQGALMQGKAEQ